MMNAALDVTRPHSLRRVVAGLVVAALPLLHNVPAVGGLNYGAVWGYFVPGFMSGVTADVLLFATCFVSPLNTAVCGGLALL